MMNCVCASEEEEYGPRGASSPLFLLILFPLPFFPFLSTSPFLLLRKNNGKDLHKKKY